ncbi:alpha/beta hydrolase family protein [Ceratobasidium sp. AG-Ba]|nr:alpha/beta hydrolase family protein [Ceratobasidium sp. AG-Ba]QRW06847.1 alpha/beta hydrolase family protein [Ceratobasidium sp. AG-Ba]
MPEHYGLAPGKTLNLNLTTPDGWRIGGWLVVADSFYQTHIMPSPPTQSIRDAQSQSSKHPDHYDPRERLSSILPLALRTHPTILYFHGNSMTRAFHLRTRLYSTLTSRLNANVLVIDYRGFGDSEGTPSEKGLILDARTAWDWLIQMGARPEDITILGESLGTGVSTGLVTGLEKEGTSPRSMVLLAPYSSITKLLETYNIGGKFPILGPLQSFPLLFNYIVRSVEHRFDSLSIINDIRCHITIIHAVNDWHIPISHARALFDSLLEPLLPVQPSDLSRSKDVAKARREELVAVKEVKGVGTIQRFERGESKGSVIMLETTWGGHKWIREIEGVVDAIGWSVRIDTVARN